MIRSAAIFWPLLLGLAGCGAFGTTDLIQKDVKGATAFSTDANRRLAFAGRAGDEAVAFCAEPSPDVSANLDDTIKAAIEAGLKIPGEGEGEAKANFEQVRKLVSVILTARTPGLQINRDVLSQACFARAAGYITNEQYLQVFRSALATAAATRTVEAIVAAYPAGTPPTEATTLAIMNFMQIMIAQPE